MTANPDYLHSPRRALVRGAITRRTRRRFKTVTHIPCALCHYEFRPEELELHEFPGRGTVYNKASLEDWPVCLHALICRECHEGRGVAHPNSRAGMAILLHWSINLWGRAACRNQIWRYGRKYSPISSLYLDYTLLEDEHGDQGY